MRMSHPASIEASRRWPTLTTSFALLALALIIGHATPAIAQAQPININFQPASSPVPSGHLPDSGQVFGNRGNGYSYGWNVSHTSRAKAYTPPFPWLNLRYWTLIEMLSASDTKWEIAVPNGTYLVTVGAGGPVLNGTRQKITVEGVLVVDDLPIDYSPWVGGSATITVRDGRLTVSNATGATKNWITFIEIVPQT